MATSRQIALIEEDIKSHVELSSDISLKKVKLKESEISINESSNLEIEISKNCSLRISCLNEFIIYSKIKFIVKEEVEFKVIFDINNLNFVGLVEFDVLENSKVFLFEKLIDMKYFKVDCSLGTKSLVNVKCAYSSSVGRSSIFHNLVHIGSKSVSNLDVRGIASSKAFVVNDGLVKIEKNAHHSVGHQNLKNIILETGAKIYSEPQLEVATSKVECSHASSISKIKENEIFYLMSRGLSLEDAQKLIIEGFFLSVDKGFEN